MISNRLREFEDFIGFQLKRKEITLDSGEPHDETFSYGLALRFYGKEEELRQAIEMGNMILMDLKLSDDLKLLERLYDIVGCMYYILGKFDIASQYFLKAISFKRGDITEFIELLFCLRAMEYTETFTKAIFDLEGMSSFWSNDMSDLITLEKLVELIKKNG